MTTCLCPSCCDAPAPTYTEEFKAECFMRSIVADVMSMPSLESRRAAIALYGKKRGADAQRELERAVEAEWAKTRRAA